MGPGVAQPLRLIVNPLAGRGFGGRSVPVIRRLLGEHGMPFDLVTTTRAGEAIDLARQAMLDGCKTVVAVGGDGTCQEVINGMMAAAAEMPEGAFPAGVVGDMGVIPTGSGCDFAWSVGIPGDLEEACARLARGQTRVVDLGRVTVDAAYDRPWDSVLAARSAPDMGQDTAARARQGQTWSRYFDNTVGIGFDGIVTAECQKFKRLRGMALYLPTVLKVVFLSFRPTRSAIAYESDGSDPGGAVGGGATGRLDKTVLMTTICNGQREGGGFYIAPEARNDDGLLDLCVAENIPRLRILAMIPHFIKGTHVDKPEVTMRRSKKVVVTSPDPLVVHADGEMLCADGHRVECEILPRRLRVIG